MSASLPTRLHHTAYVTKDLAKTRAFYEDLIGLPLAATWCESDVLFGEVRTYCHCFFGLADEAGKAEDGEGEEVSFVCCFHIVVFRN